ncbi:MAG TPA: PEP-CTERM sorting domain-containing protein [Verrucomicrobiota bacterium]|nr:hypothetical protein [Verrucomicrobiales bacterium]HRI15443.1 PEP-CTERM sorting domain-containing protein [Verrucomicrobiota bacterium]
MKRKTTDNRTLNNASTTLLRRGGAGAGRTPVIRWAPIALGSVVLAAGIGRLVADPVDVPNYSFESPTVPEGFPVSNTIDSWQKTPQPVWFDPNTFGIEWNQLSGVFPNPPSTEGNHIDNMTGNQALYLFALPTVGLFQEVGANFTAGMAYTLTIGILGGGGIPEGSTFEFGIYYEDGVNGQMQVASNSVEFTSASFPTATHLIDYQTGTVVVQPGDAWVGKAIGVSLVATSGTGAGYWDLDNIRLDATVVPEPSSWGLAILGLGGVLWGCHSRRRN